MSSTNIRKPNEARPLVLEAVPMPQKKKPGAISIWASRGHTKILCSATWVEGTPRFVTEGQGWLTAEYGMLPVSTSTRCDREAARGKQNGRTVEIQRLIGRALRNAIDFKKLGDATILIDCDVFQADGSTRTTAITGSCVALVLLLQSMQYQKKLKKDPLRYLISAISVASDANGKVHLDPDYAMDLHAGADINVVMNEAGDFLEIQGTAEGHAISKDSLDTIIAYATEELKDTIELQKNFIKQYGHD
jgi:ribonuclease PH